MLKITWYCSGCNKSGKVKKEELPIIAGQCPVCGRHHGEVEYECTMTKEEFEKELSEMSDREKKKYDYAIEICKEQFGIVS